MGAGMGDRGWGTGAWMPIPPCITCVIVSLKYSRDISHTGSMSIVDEQREAEKTGLYTAHFANSLAKAS